MASLSVLTFISRLFLFFWAGLIGLFEGASTFIIQQFATDIEDILGLFSGDLTAYGIWSVPIMVLLLCILAAGIFLILDFARLGEDFT